MKNEDMVKLHEDITEGEAYREAHPWEYAPQEWSQQLVSIAKMIDNMVDGDGQVARATNNSKSNPNTKSELFDRI